MNKSIIIANLSYNETGWRNIYINPNAKHSYAKEYPGHESLNFNFNKKGIDTDDKIHGYFQWTAAPTKFKDGGIIIFYSMNTNTNKGEIIGIYGDVEIIANPKALHWPGFENDTTSFPLRASRNLSILFPIPLDAAKYKKSKSSRLVGQIGFSYYEINILKNIIKDEILALSESGIGINEVMKLHEIYYFATEEKLTYSTIDKDDKEIEELEKILKYDKNEIINDLKNRKFDATEIVVINGTKYKRDNKSIVQLKILRNFECQICLKKIKKKDGGYYIEAAHIKAKNLQGKEVPENILILCPNHHKEFDYGDLEIISHDKSKIDFIMNGRKHQVNLKLE